MGQISTTRSIFTESVTYYVRGLKYVKGENRIPIFHNFLNGEFGEKLK